MPTSEDFRAFADRGVVGVAHAIRERDVAEFNRHFDPELPDEPTETKHD